ncbi:hypothetical protein U1Q18_014145, partial [Sarracenia purpurea var. burkii]
CYIWVPLRVFAWVFGCKWVINLMAGVVVVLSVTEVGCMLVCCRGCCLDAGGWVVDVALAAAWWLGWFVVWLHAFASTGVSGLVLGVWEVVG